LKNHSYLTLAAIEAAAGADKSRAVMPGWPRFSNNPAEPGSMQEPAHRWRRRGRNWI